MKLLKIYDTTLRDGEQAPGFTMSQKTKLRLAQKLEELGVDVLEAGFPASSDENFDTVWKIAEEIHSTELSALCRAKDKDIELAARALSVSHNFRLHIIVPASDILITSQFESTKNQILDLSYNSIKKAASLCDTVHLSLMDATRADEEFLKQLIQGALEAGVKIINAADSVGIATPEKINWLTQLMVNNTPESVQTSVHCHNDLGLATANTIAAVSAGIDQIECTLGGIGERSGNAALEECAMILKLNQEQFSARTKIKNHLLYPTASYLFEKLGKELPYNKAIIGKNSFLHESGIHQHGVIKNSTTYEPFDPALIGRKRSSLVIGPHSGVHGLRQKIQELTGIEITDARKLQRILKSVKQQSRDGGQLTDSDLIKIIDEE
jgi:2-isopropylmalate synthase